MSCPYKNKVLQKCPVTKNTGGCPVMKNDVNRRDPGLDYIKERYEIEYITKNYDFLKDSFNSKLKKNKLNINEYLLETLLINNDIVKKLRKLKPIDIINNFEIIKEEGNYFYRKNNFEKAYKYYLQSYSIIKWLENKDEHHKIIDKLFDNDININDIMKKEITQDDHNNELDLKKSMLTSICMNICVTLINLGHYSTAKKALWEIKKDVTLKSYFKFRQAQIINSNLSSSLPELKKGLKLIEKAIILKKNEKVFNKNNEELIKFSLENHEYEYNNLKNKIISKINKKENNMKEFIDILNYHKFRLKNDTKVSDYVEFYVDYTDDNNKNIILLEYMKKKLIEIYKNNIISDKDINNIKNEYNKFMIDYLKLKEYNDYNLNELIDEDSNKNIYLILDHFKKEFIFNYFNNCNFNFDLFKMALKHYNKTHIPINNKNDNEKTNSFKINNKYLFIKSFLFLIITLIISKYFLLYFN